MEKRSLADAQAHLSELVDDAEHRGKRIVILRDGKPAAALVPVAVTSPRRAARRWKRAQVEKSLRSFIAELSAASPDVSAVDDLLVGRR